MTGAMHRRGVMAAVVVALAVGAAQDAIASRAGGRGAPVPVGPLSVMTELDAKAWIEGMQPVWRTKENGK